MTFRAVGACVIGLVALTAAIAATLANGPSRTGQPAPARSDVSAVQVLQARHSPELCNVFDNVEALSVTRTVAFPQNGFTFAFPSRNTVHSTTAAKRVARAICALPLVPTGPVFHCPIDFGVVYHLVFTRTTGESMRPITADATGCQFVNGAGPGSQSRTATETFWAVLGRALRLADPTNATFVGSPGQA